jgi:microsomal dipeptidase-like Zn-dependent dipeptidase
MSVAAAPIADCHSDVMIDVARRRAREERAVLAEVHLPGLREGGVGLAVCPVAGDVSSLCPLGLDRPFESALELIALLEADAEESQGRVAVVRSAAETRSALEDGVLADDAILAEAPDTDPADLAYPVGVESAREFGSLVAGLARPRFSPAEVDPICSGNLLRVLADVEAA